MLDIKNHSRGTFETTKGVTGNTTE